MGLIKKRNTQLDEELFKRISEGDKDAFRELYYSTQKQVFSFLLSLTRNYHDAEDLMQDTYVKVRSASYLYNGGNRMSWIFKIARNQFLDKCRHENHFTLENYEDYENDVSDFGVKSVEDRIFIKWVLKILDEDERKIVLLHIISGMKYREIGELLDIKTMTVITKYNRAIRKIQEQVNEEV